MRRYKQAICFFLFFVFFVMITGTTLASDINVEKVGSLGGPTYAFDLVGNYAYIGQGQDFVILDITNPSSPSLLGRVTTNDYVEDIEVSGSYAYVADNTNGFLVIDISNPSSPTIIGRFDTVDYSADYSAYRVSISGNYAYVTVYHYSNERPDLLIIDISNPSSPVLAGSYCLYNAVTISDISVSGNYVYSVGFKGFSIIDVSNPSNPTLVGSYENNLQSGIFSISGNYAYFANGFDGLLIVDISNPLSPVTKGSYNNLGSVKDVSISSNYAYVTTTDDGLKIIDVSDPSSPTLVGSCPEETGYRVWILGNNLYVNSGGGLHILDISNPSSPVIKGKYSTAASVGGVSISGNYAYIADGSNGLDIIDIRNPSSPIFKGICDTDGQAYEVSVSGNYAYVADGTNGLVVIDISNPSFPIIKGSCDIEGYTEFISVSGNYAYVNGVYIIDISNPSTPTIVGSCKGNHDISVSGNYAYCTWYSGGFDIYDISKPSSPTLMGSYDKGSGLDPSISVSGNYAYFMGGQNDMYGTNGGFWIINVSNPSSPTLTGGCTDTPDDGSISVSGNYAAVGGVGGLYIIDISNPSSPTLAGSYPIDESVDSIWLQNNYAYVDYGRGFVILKTDIQNQEPTEGSLVQVEDHPEVYLIENGMKRHFTSSEALLWNGYSFEDIKTITSEALQSYPDGEDISITQAIIDKYKALGGEPIFGASLGEGEKDGDKDSDGVYCSYVNFKNGSIDCFKNGGRIGKAYAVFNPLYAKWASMGYAKSVLGYPIDNMSNEEASKFGTKFRYQNFANGTEKGALEYNLTSKKVFEIHGAIFAKWGALGYAQSNLGLPIMDQEYRGGHWYCEFEGGNIYWDNSAGDYKVKLGGTGSIITVGQGAPNSEIKQSFIDAYNRNGGVNVLGNPTKEVHRAWGYLVQDFPGASGYAGGIIMYNPYNKRAYYIHGEIWDKYYALGGPNAKTDIKFVLGPPTSDIEPYIHSQPPKTSHYAEFRYQNFEGGALEYNTTSGNVVEIHGEIFAKWKKLGYASSELGLVTSNEREAGQSPIKTEGRVSDFEDGHIHWHRNGPNANKAFETHGVIDDYYISQGGSKGSLGFPVSDQHMDLDGNQRSNFERGYIVTTDGVNCLAYSTKDSVLPTLTIIHPIYLHDNMVDLSGTAYDSNGVLNNEVKIEVFPEGLDHCSIETYARIISSYWSASNIPLYYGNNEIKVSVRDTNYNLMEVTTSVYCPYPDFSFAHITDVHICNDFVDLPEGTLDENGNKIERYVESISKLGGTIRQINRLNPEFILVTGDCVEYDDEELFENYCDAITTFIDDDIEIYNTPGNHDRRNSFCIPTNLVNYCNTIKMINGPNEPLNDGYEDYYFKLNDYMFIGLESGADYSQQELEELKFTPEGDGLKPDQIKKIEGLDPNIPKIIFMHHPVINEGNDQSGNPKVENDCTKYGGNDECIAFNRCNFINNCTKNNVQLVLTGHTHKSYDKSVSDTRFIQTPSATRDKDGFNHGYRIIDIIDGKAIPEEYTPTSKVEYLRAQSRCPVHLHTYDSRDRHTGLNTSGGVEMNIPDSFYIGRYNHSDANENEATLLYNTTEDYRFEIVANLTEEEKNSPEIESFNFTIEQEKEDMSTTISYLNVPLTENTTATLPINLTTTSYTMEIDSDGDGTNDETRDPYSIETNYAPTASIISPETGRIYSTDKPIEFNGTGRDPEDGILTNFSLVWYSDIDGVFGSGEKLSTANLSAGVHMVSLMVNDNVGLVDTDNVMITVVDRTPPSSITNLQFTNDTTWLNWTWTNPTDTDFNHTEIHLDGIFQTNTSAEYFNATGLEPDTSYTIGTRTVDNNENVNETWVNSTAKTKPDIIAPVIESAVIYPVNTTAGSNIGVTVNATDNIRVTSVTAGDVQLTTVDGLWRGNVTAPSSTGKYSLLINARDAAGNSANASVPYSVVRRQGKPIIGVSPEFGSVVAGKSSILTVKVKNNQNVDDTFRIQITNSGYPSINKASLSWFNWTEKTLDLRAKQEIRIPVQVNIPTGITPGVKLFKASVNSERYSVRGSSNGYLILSRSRSIRR